MREMMFSMMRLSGAVTMFGLEQLENAVVAPLDTQSALVRLCKTLDAMSESLSRKLDSSNRATLDSMSRAQTEVFDRTIGVVDLDAAGDFVMKTSETFSDAISRPPNGKAAGAA